MRFNTGFHPVGGGGGGGGGEQVKSFPPKLSNFPPPRDFDINLINCQALALKQVQIIVLVSAVSNF